MYIPLIHLQLASITYHHCMHQRIIHHHCISSSPSNRPAWSLRATWGGVTEFPRVPDPERPAGVATRCVNKHAMPPGGLSSRLSSLPFAHRAATDVLALRSSTQPATATTQRPQLPPTSSCSSEVTLRSQKFLYPLSSRLTSLVSRLRLRPWTLLSSSSRPRSRRTSRSAPRDTATRPAPM